MKFAVEILASAAGIAAVALLLGVLVRLTANAGTAYFGPSPDRPVPPPSDEVLREALTK